MIKFHGRVAENGQTGVVEAVCRDSNGLYLGSSALVLIGNMDACREAQSLAEALGGDQIFIISENKQILRGIEEKKGGSHSSVSCEITRRIGNFDHCRFLYVLSHSSLYAPSIAIHVGLLSLRRHLWLYYFP